MRADSPGHSVDSEEVSNSFEEESLNIQPDARVAALLGQKKKKTSAAAKIENLLRRRAIQFQILDARRLIFSQRSTSAYFAYRSVESTYRF